MQHPRSCLGRSARGQAARRRGGNNFFSQLSKNGEARKKERIQWVSAVAERKRVAAQGQFYTKLEKDTDHQDTKKESNAKSGAGKCAVRPWSAKQVFLLCLGLVKAKYILYGVYIHTNHLEIANAEYQNGLDSCFYYSGQGCVSVEKQKWLFVGSSTYHLESAHLATHWSVDRRC